MFIVAVVWLLAQLRLFGAKARVVEIKSGKTHYFRPDIKRWLVVPYWDPVSEMRSTSSEFGNIRYYHSYEYDTAEAAEAIIKKEFAERDERKALHSTDFTRTVMRMYDGR